MIYKNLKLPKKAGRPFFYTSFVVTIDGKVQVNKTGYWPIGSRIDYQTFTFLRAHADAIVDGKNTALRFGKNTIDTINSLEFIKLRQSLGKTKKIDYVVVARRADEELESVLQNPYGFKPIIFTKTIGKLVAEFTKQQKQAIFIDGGPHLLGSFFALNLIDEVFLTIAPKIFGNRDNLALTMVEGALLSKDKIPHLKLLSVNKVGDEVYLRYRVLP